MKATRDDFMHATQNVLTLPSSLELVYTRPEFIQPMVDFSILICNRLADREFDSYSYAEAVHFLANQIMPDKPCVGSYMMQLAIVSFGLRLYDGLRDVLNSKKG